MNYIEELLYKGQRIDNGDYVEGYYWIDKDYIAFGNYTERHYIRVQHNMDWNLTMQKDYKVFPRTVGQHIGYIDKNNIKIFRGDIVKDCHGDTWELNSTANIHHFIHHVIVFETLEGNILSNVEVIGMIHNS